MVFVNCRLTMRSRDNRARVGDDGAMRLLLVLTGVAATVGLAVPAHADPGGVDADFLSALNKAGITYASGDQAVEAGKTACQMLDQGQSDVEVVKRVTELNPGFTISGAAKFTAIAASAYCPQYVNGGGASPNGGDAS
ncbi:DUF732 domain-containing protein [Mycobacterium branderi]|uniref:DUF732 domain-containing protein n=2 Tax=Mycobacterium branderi TaxID=43348 RepID=A0ABM7KSX5_9MYCO|nr:hypothetical protein MBRA_44860 [Mycobacterium branderi]